MSSRRTGQVRSFRQRLPARDYCGFDKKGAHAPPLSDVDVGAAAISITERSKELAKRLLAFETASVADGVHGAEVQFAVCDKLRRPLAALAGSMGVQALLCRALILTKIEIPRLALAEVGSNGCVENLRQIAPRLDAEEAAQGEIVLIGNIVDLLCTFLGETLALRLIQDVWPDASFNDRDDGRDTNS